MARLDQSAENPILIAALQYGKRGWPVFPCRPKDKAPACKHGFKDATTVPAEIIRFWKQTPHANLGVATGGTSRLIVLDVDPRNGGDRSIAELQRRHGDLPLTVKVETGGGGQHYYFELPEGCEVKCSLLADGLDLKATGGYVLAPPSVHPNGKRYRWACAPSKQALAPVPQWLLESAASKPKLRKTTRAADQVDASETPLGRLFDELGMLGQLGQDGKRSVICPWQREHTGGAPARR